MLDLKKLFPRVAIIADQMVAFGGADREMFSVLKLLPYADIFTITYESSQYPNLKNRVYTSFVQKLSKYLPKNFYRHLKVLTPLAYESFDLEGYDLVLSISAGPAKAVITNIYQPHIALVMTPPRSLWDKELNVRGSKLKKIYEPIAHILNTYMRVWDLSISKRIDYWTANSKFIVSKIKKIYGKDATVIYPGVEKKYFLEPSSLLFEKVKAKYKLPKDFVLVVSRLYDYKRVDWAIRACIESKQNLIIVGEGPDRKYLERIALGNENVKFLSFVKEDEEVKVLYRLAKVLLFSGIEDFGLVPLEAMAAGTPVLAYGYGGVLETIKANITGEFFHNEEELTSLLINFNKKRYNTKKIVNHAKEFSEEKFLINLERHLIATYEKEKGRKDDRYKSSSSL
ncbi:MAG: glycosyltransferase [Candidatus Dojkabacteria bacterium]